MTLCLCRADVHGAPEGQGQRSLDSESIDVGLCGSDKVKGDHLQFFFFFSDSQRAYGSKNKTKQNQKNTSYPSHLSNPMSQNSYDLLKTHI